MINRVRFAFPCLLVVAAALCGCHDTPPPMSAQGTPAPAPQQPVHEAVVPPTAPAKPPPIQDAVTALLAKSGSSPFPKGTRVLSADLKDGVVSLDFSKEFNALANSGDTTESMAMHALQATLAQFPEVQKMRATVEGKSFDSQNTDWNTPFDVRNSGAKAGGEGQGGGQ